MLPGQIVTFQKSIGDADNESAYDVIETPDGYLLAGEIMDANTGVSSALLIEIDKNGAILWQKSYPQFNEGGFRYVARANDGGYVAWGSVFTPDDLSSNALLAKVDAAGNLVWHQTVGESGFGDIPTGAIIPVSDGYLLSGGKINTGYFQPFILRVDNLGQTIWSKFNPAPGYSVMRAAYVSDSLLYLSGTVDGLGCRRIMDVYSGAIMESREYRVDMTNWIADMQSGPGGSQIMAGQISRDVPGQIRIDAWLQKTDADGVVEWAKTYKKGYFNVFESLIAHPDGSNIAILNYFNEPGAIDFNTMIVAADSDGNLLWATDFSGNNVYGRLSKIIQTADGGLLAVGQLRDRNNAQVQTDIHIMKLDSLGKLQSCCRVTPDLVVENVSVEPKMTGINESDYEPTIPLLFATTESPDLHPADFCNAVQPVLDSTLLFCPGETLSIDGNTYTQPGILTLSLPSTTGGCDTLATYTLQYASENQGSNLQLQCPADITATIPAGQSTLTIDYDLPFAGSDCVCPNLPLNLVSGSASGSAFGPGTHTVCYQAGDDCGSEKTCCFNISLEEEGKACDIKTIGCLQFELRSVNLDAAQNRVYRIRVTNLCDPALQYVYIQVPDGVQADSPGGGSVYTTPGGNHYTVKNPNFSPFASIRFQPVGPGLSGGASDVFRYVLPAQTAPQYIHVAARLTNGVLYEAYLNTFFCPVGTELPRPAGERSTAQTGELRLSPNPASPGSAWMLHGMELPEGSFLLYDASGRQVLHSAIADNRILTNVTNGATGLCYFRVFSEGRFAGSGKVVIGN